MQEKMTYSISELAHMAGVSKRTLHHYDHIGLLVPVRDENNDYRRYSQQHLLQLQQILFYRELKLPLEEIKRILHEPTFDPLNALKEHRAKLHSQQERIGNLLVTIARTIAVLEGEQNMSDKDLYQGFSEEKQKEYEKEIREKYGDEPLNTSIRNWNSLSKAEQKEKIAQGNELHQRIANAMQQGHDSPQVQQLIEEYFKHMQFFYPVSLERFADLGHMYNQDPAFKATYEAVKPGLAHFMELAIEVFVKQHKKD